MTDLTVSSTGFVNYFPSSERTDRKVKEAYQKYGEYIAIIDGDDDWYASHLFRPGILCEDWKIPVLGKFHTGISGISNSGVVISKKDLESFINKFNRNKYSILRDFPHKGLSFDSIKIYDKEKNGWMTFFEMNFDFERNEAIVKISNFKEWKNGRKISIK